MVLTRPTWKQKMLMMIIFLTLISFAVVSTNDNDALHETKNPRDGYDTVFKNIPKLFQNFMEVLDEKPGLLERNDVTVFKRDANHNFTNISNSSNDNMSTDVEHYVDYSTGFEGDSTTKIFEKDADEFQVDISDDFYEYVGDSGEKHKTEEIIATPRGGQFEDDIFMGTVGVNSLKLTPEEIYSNSVMVEQMLDDYNSSK